MPDKPRVRFCWACGRKLYGNHHAEKSIPLWTGDDLERILHKACGDRYDKGDKLENVNDD